MTFFSTVDSSMLATKIKIQCEGTWFKKCLTACKWHFASVREQTRFSTCVSTSSPSSCCGHPSVEARKETRVCSSVSSSDSSWSSTFMLSPSVIDKGRLSYHWLFFEEWTRPDMRQDSRGQLGRGSNAKEHSHSRNVTDWPTGKPMDQPVRQGVESCVRD